MATLAGFNVASATAWVAGNSDIIWSKMLANAEVFRTDNPVVTLVDNVVYSQLIPKLDSSPVFQARCTEYTSGQTIFTDLNLVTASLSDTRWYCPDTLNGYVSSIHLKPGNETDNLTDFLINKVVEINSKYQALELEKMFFRGDTSSSNANLARFDGFLEKMADNFTTCVTAGTSSDNSAWSATSITTVDDIINDMVSKIPSDLQGVEGLKLYMGKDAGQLYRLNLAAANYFKNYGMDNNGKVYVPGTSIEVVELAGMNVTDAHKPMFISYPENLVVGVNTNEAPYFAYSPDKDQYLYRTNTRGGVGVFDYSHVVINFLTFSA